VYVNCILCRYNEYSIENHDQGCVNTIDRDSWMPPTEVTMTRASQNRVSGHNLLISPTNDWKMEQKSALLLWDECQLRLRNNIRFESDVSWRIVSLVLIIVSWVVWVWLIQILISPQIQILKLMPVDQISPSGYVIVKTINFRICQFEILTFILLCSDLNF
jgi:hypothetical protein